MDVLSKGAHHTCHVIIYAVVSFEAVLQYIILNDFEWLTAGLWHVTHVIWHVHHVSTLLLIETITETTKLSWIMFCVTIKEI